MFNEPKKFEGFGFDAKHVDRATFERMCRNVACYEMIDLRTAKCKVMDRWIVVDVRDKSLAPHLMRLGLWESWITIAFLRDLNKRDRFIDVGANFGWYSLIADIAGATVVGAVEASDKVATLLQSTFNLNSIPAPVYQFAAWSIPGVNLFLANDDSNQGGASVMSSPGVRRVEGEVVHTITLDQLQHGLPVDVVKIDVESSELEVWRGMKSIRERNPALRVWMEFTPCGQEDALESLREIEADGFEIRVVDPNSQLVKRPLEKIAAEPEWIMLYLRRPN